MSAIFHMELHEDGAEHGRTPSAALDGSIRNRLDSADDFEDDNVDDDEFDEDLFIHADVPSDDDDEDGGDGVQAEEIVIGDVGFDSAEPFAPKVGSQDFQILSLIGKGAYGKVFLVRKITGKDRGELFAMKVLRKASLVVRTKDVEHTRAERSILERLRYPFIVNLMYAYQTDNKLYLILEFAAGGELFTYMATEGMFMEDTAKIFLAELVLAIEHVHSLGIIYRDLKPENILLGKDGHILLTDFGLSKVPLDDDGRTNTCCGTTEYMAPETLSNHRYGHAVDWWSLGAVMYDMLAGQPPFTANNRKATMEKIMNGKLKLPMYFTPDAKDLVRKLLRKAPNTRLGYNGADEVKRHPFFKSIDWGKLARRELPSPIKPVLTSDVDVSNFDKQFTSMPAADSPSEPTMLTDSYRDAFKGFSYMAPSLLESMSSLTRSPNMHGLNLSSSPLRGRHRPQRAYDDDVEF